MSEETSSTVREVKSQKDFRDREYSTNCWNCDCELAVLPPARLKYEDEIWDWLDSHYFYCKRCQKSEGVPEIEKCE